MIQAQKSMLSLPALVLSAAVATFVEGRNAGIQTGGIDVLSLQLTNNGANPLTGFAMLARVSADAPFVPVKSSAWTTADSVVLSATSDPATLTAGGSTILQLDVSGFDAVRFVATSASGTTLAAYAGGGN